MWAGSGKTAQSLLLPRVEAESANHIVSAQESQASALSPEHIVPLRPFHHSVVSGGLPSERSSYLIFSGDAVLAAVEDLAKCGVRN